MTQETQKKVQKKYRIAQVVYQNGGVYYVPEVRGISGLTGPCCQWEIWVIVLDQVQKHSFVMLLHVLKLNQWIIIILIWKCSVY